MGNAKPTMERRQLGLTLKRWREQAGYSQTQAAKHIGLSDSRISKLEDGVANLSSDKLAALIGFYRVPDDERQTILALGADARKRSARQPKPYTDLLPGSFQRFADLEADAVKIHTYESGVIPGLLQSPGYMGAIIDSASVWWQPAEPVREQRLAFRIQRQQNTWGSDNVRELHFIIGEAAINQVVGGAEVMREQLGHLVDVVDQRENVTLQLLPFSVSDNPAPGGGLTVLEFGLAVPRVSFVSVTSGPSTYHDEPERTDTMLRVFNRLRQLALSPEQTKRAIARKKEDY